MLIFFITIFLAPVLLSLLFFICQDETKNNWRNIGVISVKEFLMMVGAQLLIAGTASAIIYHSDVSDVEIQNGYVGKKAQVSVPCSHSYQCNCREECSGSGKDRSCYTHCDTCYEHSNDWNWDVYTTNNETITIDRVDRRGSDEPPRWSLVRVGEPTAIEHSFTNYIKASPDSLFRYQGLYEKHKNSVPKYPRVYDYYKVNRFKVVGSLPITKNEYNEWNANLMKLNGTLGRKNQVNIHVILGKNKSPDWFYAVEQSWIGGKKNDAVLIVSVDKDMNIQWVNVMAWTTNKMFQVKLVDDINDLKKIDRQGVIGVLYNNVSSYYKRKPMSDFEYLQSRIVPSTTEWIVTMLIGLIITFILVIACKQNEFFE